jgi:hypothetical protein
MASASGTPLFTKIIGQVANSRMEEQDMSHIKRAIESDVAGRHTPQVTIERAQRRFMSWRGRGVILKASFIFGLLSLATDSVYLFTLPPAMH